DEEVHIVHGDGQRCILSTSGAPIRDEDGRIAGAVTASIDITERKRIEVQLMRREEEMRAATLAAEVGVWTWTPGTSSVSVGANWRGLFGVDPGAEVTLETWVGALHPDDRDRALQTLNGAWRERQQFAMEYRVLCPDGTVRWLIDRGRASFDSSGNATGMAGINVDITQRKMGEEALREANRLKDEFLATLSHELRTPLNAIVGWSDLLRRGGLQPDDTIRAAESIFRNARVQSELIEDVLDVSRIISGKVLLETRPVEPVTVLRGALDSTRPAAEAKGVAIVTELDEALPFPIAGDPTRIQQVFWNLLSNAVKFTPRGGLVRVSLRFVDGQVRVQVKDTGIGIGAPFLPHVFERFRQEDSSITREHGGLGLGLAIARHLVELHGGTVTAASEGEGRGATFTVTLPATRFEERRREEHHVARYVKSVEPDLEDVSNLCGLRVMLVDDEPDSREVAASVLCKYGASVGVAANGAQALEQFELFDPQVVLIDIAMPEMDGYALLEHIRTSTGAKGKNVPAIAFTAFAREEDRRRALAGGFQLHLAKPVDSHTLVRVVGMVGRRHGA
ncbi:MAG: response regulator, partial [Acidobacteria bacterium]